MTSWFITPETDRLDLSDGQWILVKRRLNRGELREAYARMYLAGADGSLKVNPLATGVAMVTAYLLDWSLTDDAGKPVAIRGLSPDNLTSILDCLDPERFGEISAAIDAHIDAVDAARAQEKKLRNGDAGATTSPSPSGVAGRLTTSVN